MKKFKPKDLITITTTLIVWISIYKANYFVAAIFSIVFIVNLILHFMEKVKEQVEIEYKKLEQRIDILEQLEQKVDFMNKK